jgi:hypothetical protein
VTAHASRAMTVALERSGPHGIERRFAKASANRKDTT